MGGKRILSLAGEIGLLSVCTCFVWPTVTAPGKSNKLKIWGEVVPRVSNFQVRWVTQRRQTGLARNQEQTIHSIKKKNEDNNQIR